jgi:hypothetical protein
VRVSESRRWRVQAFWKYGSEEQSRLPAFADTEADARRLAAGMRYDFDHPVFQDLEIGVEVLDAAIADAEEAALRENETLTPEVFEQRIRAYMEAQTSRSPEWIEAVAEVHALMGASRKQQKRHRPQDARLLLSQTDFVRVERFDEGDRGRIITFNDVAAVTFEDLVEQTVDVARAFPGVTDAWHEDRELIMLSGDFDPRALEQSVREWWLERLRHELAL